ncbi:MAG: TVP38/TMEM64 family protein [Bacilli bacterium]|nr:VTT domain-containing protein [Bacilli bacterium]
MLVFLEFIIIFIIESLKGLGPLLGFIIVVLESIVPILPLSLFITLNMYAYGSVFGFVLSWLGTTVGCMLTFLIFRKWFSKYLYQKIKKQPRFNKIMTLINNVEFSQLVILNAIPFLPVLLINVGAGVSKIAARKFLLSLLIGKVVIVYFWGYIGMNIVDSIKNPIITIEVILMLIVVYFLSKLVSRKLRIE